MSKKIFDELNNYFRNYVLIQGGSLVRYRPESKDYYFDTLFDENSVTPLTSYYIDFDLLNEALNEIDVEVSEEGFYSFSALLKVSPFIEQMFPEYSIEHIEFKMECDINEHFRRIDEFNSFMNKMNTYGDIDNNIPF